MVPPLPLKGLPGTGPITADKALKTVAENYGIARDNADQLTNLQDWIRSTNK